MYSKKLKKKAEVEFDTYWTLVDFPNVFKFSKIIQLLF